MSFEAGIAIIHRGQHRHEATRLTSGERINLVVWIFGDGGSVRISEYPEDKRHTEEEREGWFDKKMEGGGGEL